MQQSRGIGIPVQRVSMGAFNSMPRESSPGRPRWSEGASPHRTSEPVRGIDKRPDMSQGKMDVVGISTRGTTEQNTKIEFPRQVSAPALSSRQDRMGSTPPRSATVPVPLHSASSPRKTASRIVQRDGSEPRSANMLRPPRLRRYSGDSDSSASSVQSGPPGLPGRKFSDGALLTGMERASTPRKKPLSRSQSQERSPTTKLTPSKTRSQPNSTPEERGRPRGPHGPVRSGMQSPNKRAQNQGQAEDDDAVLIISRGKDGQHSWSLSGQQKTNGFGKPPTRTICPPPSRSLPVGSKTTITPAKGRSSPLSKKTETQSRMPPRPQGSRTPQLGRSSRASPSHVAPSVSLPASEPCESIVGDLGNLTQAFLAPLQIDSKQEQLLYKSLEEEFIANSQLMGMGYEDIAPLEQAYGRQRLQQATPDQAVVDSAYCSSSSSSSSLNFFSKGGIQPDLGERQREEVKGTPWIASSRCPQAVESNHELSNGSSVHDSLGPGAWNTPVTPEAVTRWRKATLSSSSDDSNYCTAPNDTQEGLEVSTANTELSWNVSGLLGSDVHPEASAQEVVVADEGTEEEDGSAVDSSSESAPSGPINDKQDGTQVQGVVMRQKKSQKRPDRIPSIYKLKLRPKIRPRADNQPDKKPTKIPTPQSHKSAARSPQGGTPPKAGPTKHKSWRALHSIFASFTDTPASQGQLEISGQGEDSWG